MHPAVESAEQTTNLPDSALDRVGALKAYCSSAASLEHGGSTLSKRDVSTFPGNMRGRRHTVRACLR